MWLGLCTCVRLGSDAITCIMYRLTASVRNLLCLACLEYLDACRLTSARVYGAECLVASEAFRHGDWRLGNVGDREADASEFVARHHAMVKDACEMQAADRKSRLAGCRMSRCSAAE
jgi:hypothetical protein